MTGVTLETNLDNRPAFNHLRALSRVDTTPLVREMSEFMLERVLDHFESETTPEGDKWEPSQRVIKHGGKTLQLKGHLRDSYTYHILSPVQAEIGSGMVYAAIHHFGGTIKHKAHEQTMYYRLDKDGSVDNKFVKKHQSNFTQKALVDEYEITMPARPALGLNRDDEVHLDRIVHDFFKEVA